MAADKNMYRYIKYTQKYDKKAEMHDKIIDSEKQTYNTIEIQYKCTPKNQ